MIGEFAGPRVKTGFALHEEIAVHSIPRTLGGSGFRVIRKEAFEHDPQISRLLFCSEVEQTAKVGDKHVTHHACSHSHVEKAARKNATMVGGRSDV